MDCWQEVVEGGTALQVTEAGPGGSLLGQEHLGNLMLVGDFQLTQELLGDFRSSLSFGLFWKSKLARQLNLALSLGLAAG